MAWTAASRRWPIGVCVCVSRLPCHNVCRLRAMHPDVLHSMSANGVTIAFWAFGRMADHRQHQPLFSALADRTMHVQGFIVGIRWFPAGTDVWNDLEAQQMVCIMWNHAHLGPDPGTLVHALSRRLLHDGLVHGLNGNDLVNLASACTRSSHRRLYADLLEQIWERATLVRDQLGGLPVTVLLFTMAQAQGPVRQDLVERLVERIVQVLDSMGSDTLVNVVLTCQRLHFYDAALDEAIDRRVQTPKVWQSFTARNMLRYLSGLGADARWSRRLVGPVLVRLAAETAQITARDMRQLLVALARLDNGAVAHQNPEALGAILRRLQSRDVLDDLAADALVDCLQALAALGGLQAGNAAVAIIERLSQPQMALRGMRRATVVATACAAGGLCARILLEKVVAVYFATPEGRFTPVQLCDILWAFGRLIGGGCTPRSRAAAAGRILPRPRLRRPRGPARAQVDHRNRRRLHAPAADEHGLGVRAAARGGAAVQVGADQAPRGAVLRPPSGTYLLASLLRSLPSRHIRRRERTTGRRGARSPRCCGSSASCI